MAEDLMECRKKGKERKEKTLNRESEPVAAKRLKIIAQGFNPGLRVQR
jgi:hypothetical protein